MQALINTIIVAALESYSDRLGNDSCNDMCLPNTPENYELVKAAQRKAAREDNQNEDDYPVGISKDEKTISTCNSWIVDYVTDQFIENNSVDKEQIKQWVKHLS